ncbi:mucin-1-like [Bacillus rossius redtenbacheri]|uniref:mucin-1-like n=1 Tax=Bacillus rossius redtenbacheri TaxID=93214 RepID=UPI002FDD68DE
MTRCGETIVDGWGDNWEYEEQDEWKEDDTAADTEGPDVIRTPLRQHIMQPASPTSCGQPPRRRNSHNTARVIDNPDVRPQHDAASDAAPAIWGGDDITTDGRDHTCPAPVHHCGSITPLPAPPTRPPPATEKATGAAVHTETATGRCSLAGSQVADHTQHHCRSITPPPAPPTMPPPATEKRHCGSITPPLPPRKTTTPPPATEKATGAAVHTETATSRPSPADNQVADAMPQCTEADLPAKMPPSPTPPPPTAVKALGGFTQCQPAGVSLLPAAHVTEGVSHPPAVHVTGGVSPLPAAHFIGGVPLLPATHVTRGVSLPPAVHVSEGMSPPPAAHVTEGVSPPPAAHITKGVSPPPTAHITEGALPHSSVGTPPAHAMCAVEGATPPPHVKRTAEDAATPSHIKRATEGAAPPPHVKRTAEGTAPPPHVKRAIEGAVPPLHVKRTAEGATAPPHVKRAAEGTTPPPHVMSAVEGAVPPSPATRVTMVVLAKVLWSGVGQILYAVTRVAI